MNLAHIHAPTPPPHPLPLFLSRPHLIRPPPLKPSDRPHSTYARNGMSGLVISPILPCKSSAWSVPRTTSAGSERPNQIARNGRVGGGYRVVLHRAQCRTLSTVSSVWSVDRAKTGSEASRPFPQQQSRLLDGGLRNLNRCILSPERYDFPPVQHGIHATTHHRCCPCPTTLGHRPTLQCRCDYHSSCIGLFRGCPRRYMRPHSNCSSVRSAVHLLLCTRRRAHLP